MILLDTHVWVWYIDNPSQLSEKALAAIESEVHSGPLLISSISTWEIYMLEKKKRLAFKIPAESWVKKCERLSLFRFIPVNNDIALISVNLPEPFHPDPADRIITATAKHHGATLITKDRKLLNYPSINTLWE